MTIVTIESDPENKIDLLLKYAEELGMSVKTNEHRVLTARDVALGIGRKATDAELMEYLLKSEKSERLSINAVFERFKK